MAKWLRKSADNHVFLCKSHIFAQVFFIRVSTSCIHCIILPSLIICRVQKLISVIKSSFLHNAQPLQTAQGSKGNPPRTKHSLCQNQRRKTAQSKIPIFTAICMILCAEYFPRNNAFEVSYLLPNSFYIIQRDISVRSYDC